MNSLHLIVGEQVLAGLKDKDKKLQNEDEIETT